MNDTTLQRKKRTATYLQALSLLKKQKLLLCISIVLTTSSSITGMYVAVIMRNIIDTLRTSSLALTPELVGLLVTFFIFSSTSAITMFLHSVLTTLLVERLLLELRQSVIHHALGQSMDFFNNEPIGKLITLSTSDLDSVGNFFRNIITQILSSCISFVVVVSMLFILNWNLAIITMISVPLILLFINYYRKRVLLLSRDVRISKERINTYLAEHLHGKLDIQLLGKVDPSQDQFTSIANTYYQAKRSLGVLQTILRPILNLSLMIITVIVMIAGSYLTHAGILTVGIIIGYLQLINSFFFPLITIAQNITQIQESLASFEKIFSFLNITPSIVNIPPAASWSAPTPTSILEFHNVSFAYKARNWVLKDLSFTISPQKTTALVGQSGSGKSTIVKLGMRFWEPQRGHITLDGVDIRDWPLSELRKNIGLLHQDSLIFRGTLRENIAMGDELSHEQLHAIAKHSYLDTIMKRSSWNWDSEVSKDELSVGEQRIIAICRVLVNAPRILLLDEFSATLDNETERIIQHLLNSLQENRGTLIIAHRLNTIKNSDEILYIKDGTILERGNHQTLLKKRGDYYKMTEKMRETIVERSKLL